MNEYITAMKRFHDIYEQVKFIEDGDAFITVIFQLIDQWAADHNMTTEEKLKMVEETVKIQRYLAEKRRYSS